MKPLTPIYVAFALCSGYGQEAPRIAPLPDGGLVPDAEVDKEGVIHVAYLSGGDIHYIRSADEAQNFTEPIRVNTEAGFASRSGAVTAAAWETKGQIYFRVGLGSEAKEVRASESGRYPVVLNSGDGTKLVAWKADSQLVWQYFDSENVPAAKRHKHAAKNPDRPAGMVTRSGRVVLIP